jgi:hypothetical protein
LLFSAFSSEALTTRTTNVINGSAPYLTFDGGVTKVTDTEGLLGITIPGIGSITQTSHPSTSASPIEIVNNNVRFSDIGMLVPPNTNTVSLSTLIGSNYNYWRDDDGDGQGSGGITATGELTLLIRDKYGHLVSRDEILTSCNAPYELRLRSTAGRLSTRFGVPRSSTFNGSTATYYLKPKPSPTVCFAKPELQYGLDNIKYHGPSKIWNYKEGFLVQSTVASDYHKNFPTTGANNLYFDLSIIGVNAQSLSWSDVIHPSGITVKLNATSPTTVRATLVGPHADSTQINARYPTPVAVPNLSSSVPPFKIVGKDSSGREVITYGFRLKQWFVNRGESFEYERTQRSWCNSIGYSMPRVRDLTNAARIPLNPPPVGASPSSSGNYYQRYIGAGFFSEWGDMGSYTSSGFVRGVYWATGDYSYAAVSAGDGEVGHYNNRQRIYNNFAICASVLSP